MRFLADLYNPLTIPPTLVKALDKAVDAAYNKQAFTNEDKTLIRPFELYEKNIQIFVCKDRRGRKGKKGSRYLSSGQNKKK
jgi:hypothetical protein